MPENVVSDFTEMDNAGISSHHWKIMLISGMGFFTDAYDLFIIGVVMSLLKPIWLVGKLEESLVDSTALLASAFGAFMFGRVADMLGRKHSPSCQTLKSWPFRSSLFMVSVSSSPSSAQTPPHSFTRRKSSLCACAPPAM